MGSKSYSKGISWINDCRIPYVDTNEYQKRDAYKEQTIYGNGKGMPLVYWETNTQGRFPANILVSDDMLNDGIITKQSQRTYKPTDNTAFTTPRRYSNFSFVVFCFN